MSTSKPYKNVGELIEICRFRIPAWDSGMDQSLVDEWEGRGLFPTVAPRENSGVGRESWFCDLIFHFCMRKETSLDFSLLNSCELGNKVVRMQRI